MAKATVESTTTRRALLVGAAALVPAAALPASAAILERDPVFAAIERHSRADARYQDRLTQFSATDGQINNRSAAIAERRMKVRRAFEKARPEHKFFQNQEETFATFRQIAREELEGSSAEYQAADLAVEETSEAEHEAAWALALTIPTTAAGGAAFATYVSGDRFEAARDSDDENGTAMPVALLTTLATFLARA